MSYLKKKVKTILENQLGCLPRDFSEEKRLDEDLGLDDLDHVEVIFDLEKFYGINIHDSESDQWKTVGDIINYLESRITNVSSKGTK